MPRANTNVNLPGEFNAQAGMTADQEGVPALPARLYTPAQRAYGGRDEFSAAQEAAAMRAVDPMDDVEPDPFSLGQ